MPRRNPRNTLRSLYRHSFALDPEADAEFYRIVLPLLREPGIQNLDAYIQHSDITLLHHVISVSYLTYRACKRLGLNYEAGARIRATGSTASGTRTLHWPTPKPLPRSRPWRRMPLSGTCGR